MKKQLRPTKGGRKYHVITDETGSVRKIYKDGEEEWSGTYSPYGKLSSYEGSFEFSGMYAGKEIDTETGLTYHWNRWRNEEGDAFISEDPIRDGYNWYGYALGNPFKYADGTGLAVYVCRDGTFCNEGDISNPSYRADCFHYNGYNADTIASMSGPAYNLANNGGQATLSLAGTRADPGRNKSSPTAAEEIKNCGNVDVEKITLGKISDTVELLEKMQEVNERITELVVTVELNRRETKLSENNLNKIQTLHPEIRDKVMTMLENLKQAGIEPEITLAFRTYEEQDELYAKGRDSNGNIIDLSKVVTNAKGGQSYHNFGLAFDLTIYDKNGKKNWNKDSNDWKIIIEEGKKQGFDAGAEWTDFPDLPHFENSFNFSPKQLRTKKINNEVTNGYVNIK